MKLRLLYLEKGTALYAGYGFEYPLIHWDGTAWQYCDAPGARQEEWAVGLSICEAERCFPKSTTATRPQGAPDWLDVSVEEAIRLRPDTFDDYDGPNFRKAPGEDREYLAQVVPDHVKALIAARKSGKSES
jgi:hypothetical protein